MNARDGPSLTMIGSLPDSKDGSEEAAGTFTAHTHNTRPFPRPPCLDSRSASPPHPLTPFDNPWHPTPLSSTPFSRSLGPFCTMQIFSATNSKALRQLFWFSLPSLRIFPVSYTNLSFQHCRFPSARHRNRPVRHPPLSSLSLSLPLASSCPPSPSILNQQRSFPCLHIDLIHFPSTYHNVPSPILPHKPTHNPHILLLLHIVKSYHPFPSITPSINPSSPLPT